MKSIILNSAVYLWTKPDKNSASIALLKKGDLVEFDDVFVAQGYMWRKQNRTDKHKVIRKKIESFWTTFNPF